MDDCKRDSSQRVDQRVALKVRNGGLLALIVESVHFKQVGYGIASAGGAGAHGHRPAVTEASGSITAPIVLGRFKIPGEREIRRAGGPRDALQFLRRDLRKVPGLSGGEVVEALRARGEGHIWKINQDTALGVSCGRGYPRNTSPRGGAESAGAVRRFP